MFAVACKFVDHHDVEHVLCSSCGSVFEHVFVSLKARFDEIHVRGGSLG